MFNFDYDDVNLTVGDGTYVVELTARVALDAERGTAWRKFLVSEYWLNAISRLPHFKFIDELKKAYDSLSHAQKGSVLVDMCAVVGVQFVEGAADICEKLKLGDALTITPEPDNPHDCNALKVFRLGKPIGYIPKECNQKIRRDASIVGVKGGKIFARVVGPDTAYGQDTIRIAVCCKAEFEREVKWEGVERESDEDKEVRRKLESFKTFMVIHRALIDFKPCGRLIPASWYTVLPLTSDNLAKRPYLGKNCREGFNIPNDIFRLTVLPDSATGFAVFTGCCLTFICLCASHDEAQQMLRHTPSFRHHPGTRKLTEEFARLTVCQYLDGVRMFGLNEGYCYFGHQSGLDGMGECFLGPDGGMYFAYIPCCSRNGFEPYCVPLECFL